MSDLTAPAVSFPRRTDRAVLLGLSPLQLGLGAAALVLLLAVLVTTGLTGAAVLSPLWLALAMLVLLRKNGMPLVDWAPLLTRSAWRRRTGQRMWLARPVTRPRQDGLLHLPGNAASLRVVTPAGSRAAAVHDPHARTLTAVARIAGPAFALLDGPQQQTRVSGWGRALASISRTGHISCVQVLERTVPDAGDALARHWQHHGNPRAPAAEVYTDLISGTGPAAAPHEVYLAIALDLKAARRAVTGAGGGVPGAFSVMDQTTTAVALAAKSAGLRVTGWLTGPETAAVIRSAYDPAALANLQHWSAHGTAEAEPQAAGPVVQIEHWDRLTTGPAAHATYWIDQWPRTPAHPDFLHGVLFAEGVRRSLSLLYIPRQPDAAIRDVRRRKAAILSDIDGRRRRGGVASEADNLAYAEATAREQQLLAGHADIALTGLLTVTAGADTGLDAACTQVETAAANAHIDLRRLHGQQADAFPLAALPLARTAL